MNKSIFLLFLLFLLISCEKEVQLSCGDEIEDIKYPLIAHSHNDYEQGVPIFDALEHGFSSLEVDVVFDGQDIIVSHDNDDLSNKPKFEQSYLTPILEISDLGDSGIILLIDIKKYSNELITSLNTIIIKNESRFVSRETSDELANKIKVILSGDIPRNDIINDKSNEYLFIDGRLNDEDLNYSSDIVPMISIDITKLTFLNNINNSIVANIIDEVHQNGKKIRFWNTQDKESVWLTLIDLNVDIIGVDNLEHFCGVMKKNDLLN